MIGEKLTCDEEYNNALEQKRKLRDEQFNVKMDIVFNKNNKNKLDLLKEKEQILKQELSKNSRKIVMYEIENNIEKDKKEGKKK